MDVGTDLGYQMRASIFFGGIHTGITVIFSDEIWYNWHKRFCLFLSGQLNGWHDRQSTAHGAWKAGIN